MKNVYENIKNSLKIHRIYGNFHFAICNLIGQPPSSCDKQVKVLTT